MATVTVNDKFLFEFMTEASGKVNVGIKHPRTDLTAEGVVNTADTLIGQNVFQDANGSPITDLVSAYREQTMRDYLVGDQA